MSGNAAANRLFMIGVGLVAGSVVAMILLAVNDDTATSLIAGLAAAAWGVLITQVLLEDR